jgi:hypothetical protein
LRAVFFAAVLRAVVFFAVAFFVVRFAAVFFAVVFFAVDFLAALVFFAGDFLAAFLVVLAVVDLRVELVAAEVTFAVFSSSVTGTRASCDSYVVPMADVFNKKDRTSTHVLPAFRHYEFRVAFDATHCMLSALREVEVAQWSRSCCAQRESDMRVLCAIAFNAAVRAHSRDRENVRVCRALLHVPVSRRPQRLRDAARSPCRSMSA